MSMMNPQSTQEERLRYDDRRYERSNGHQEAVPRSERQKLSAIATGGSAIEAMAGAGAATLAILGLAGVLPFYMTTIATIAIGAGLFVEGGSLGAAAARLDREFNADEAGSAGGLTVQSLAGAGGIVLGLLALIGVLPTVLVSVAILVMGGGMIIGGPARAELNLSALESNGATARARRAAARGVQTAGGLLALVGLGAIALGILALVGVESAQVLNLVALLGLGGALLLGSSAVVARLGVAAR